MEEAEGVWVDSNFLFFFFLEHFFVSRFQVLAVLTSKWKRGEEKKSKKCSLSLKYEPMNPIIFYFFSTTGREN